MRTMLPSRLMRKAMVSLDLQHGGASNPFGGSRTETAVTEAAVTYIELDWKTTAVVAVAQRVRLAIARSSLGVLVWFLLGYALRSTQQIREMVSAADVSTADERARMAQFANQLGQSVSLLDAACENVAKQGRLPWLARRVLARLERLCVEVEEIAETAALASSASFGQLVERDLRESLVKIGADPRD